MHQTVKEALCMQDKKPLLRNVTHITVKLSRLSSSKHLTQLSMLAPQAISSQAKLKEILANFVAGNENCIFKRGG